MIFADSEPNSHVGRPNRHPCLQGKNLSGTTHAGNITQIAIPQNTMKMSPYNQTLLISSPRTKCQNPKRMLRAQKSLLYAPEYGTRTEAWSFRLIPPSSVSTLLYYYSTLPFLGRCWRNLLLMRLTGAFCCSCSAILLKTSIIF
jgi:hypothetical protein